MNIKKYLENPEEIRRDAYVIAMYKKLEDQKVCGYFSDVNDEIFYAYNIYAFPIIGLDFHILKFSNEKNICDPINATLTYLKTKKCPIIYSSKFFVLDDYCKKFNELLAKNTQKNIVKDKDIRKYLDENYKEEFSKQRYENAKELSKKINVLIDRLYESDLEDNYVFKLAFYIKFLPEYDDRIAILNKALEKASVTNKKHAFLKANCPYGICDKLKGKKIIKAKEDSKISFKHCIYGENKKYTTYKE
ncbi:MAG: hypothetical protein Q4B52_06185 [Tissierellia bacterium]|nr:hypothetical protein [Tissierellia bacterium]